MTATAIIVLAAGRGSRMRSALPKVMHRIASRSLLGHVLGEAASLAPQRTVVVAGADMPDVGEEARRAMPDALVAIQAERRGTAHAVSMARDALLDFSGTVLVLYGDVPLIRAETLRRLTSLASAGRPLAVLGFRAADPTGYGRLILDATGNVLAIREHLDARPAERGIELCNSGIIAIHADLLWRLMPRIGADNAKGEYYLTDVVALAVAEGCRAALAECPECEVLGVNDRLQLAEAEQQLQKRYRRAAMEGGATLIAPDTVFFAFDTKLGRDVIVEPNVCFGPGVTVDDDVVILAGSHIEGAVIGRGARIGPYARLRPGAVIGEDAHIGNFVEVKKAVIERGAKANHLAYIGDARVGAKANIGAGAITANYNGYDKSFTDIGAGASIGSNVVLVAPVRIGDGVIVGAGSVITEPAAAGDLVLTRGPLEVKTGWAKRFRAAKDARRKAKKG